MKLFKNQAGFNDVIIMTIIGGIVGALFITGVFVWQEYNYQKNGLNLVPIFIDKEPSDSNKEICVVPEGSDGDKNDIINDYESTIINKNKHHCYGFPDTLGFPPRFRQTNTVDKFKELAKTDLLYINQKKLLNEFLSSEDFKAIEDKGEIYEICFEDSLTFTMYGRLELDENTSQSITIVGIYDGSNLVTNNTEIASLKGFCSIVGFVPIGDMLIDCSIGDGGQGAIKLYTLNQYTQEFKTLKDCTIQWDDNGVDSVIDCDIDIFTKD